MTRGKGTRAFSLIEVVLALGLCTFALISMVGLLSSGMRVGRDSRQQMQAANIAALLVSVRRHSPTNNLPNLLLPPLNRTLSDSPATVWVDAEGNVAKQTEASYRLNYQVGTNTVAANVALIHLRLSWPPAADPGKAAGQYELTTQVSMPQ